MSKTKISAAFSESAIAHLAALQAATGLSRSQILNKLVENSAENSAAFIQPFISKLINISKLITCENGEVKKTTKKEAPPIAEQPPELRIVKPIASAADEIPPPGNRHEQGKFIEANFKGPVLSDLNVETIIEIYSEKTGKKFNANHLDKWQLRHYAKCNRALFPEENHFAACTWRLYGMLEIDPDANWNKIYGYREATDHVKLASTGQRWKNRQFVKQAKIEKEKRQRELKLEQQKLIETEKKIRKIMTPQERFAAMPDGPGKEFMKSRLESRG